MRYDIRNSNLINFDGVRKMSEGFEKKQLEIKIVYYKSSSKYYDSVCLQCECILRPSAVTIPFWSGRFTEQNGRNVAIDYPLL